MVEAMRALMEAVPNLFRRWPYGEEMVWRVQTTECVVSLWASRWVAFRDLRKCGSFLKPLSNRETISYSKPDLQIVQPVKSLRRDEAAKDVAHTFSLIRLMKCKILLS